MACANQHSISVNDEYHFTGSDCICQPGANGDGYTCFKRCTPKEYGDVRCASDQYCLVDWKGKGYCSCGFGFKANAEGKCILDLRCDACRHNCHVASMCLEYKDSVARPDWDYSCDRCNEKLGYKGDGYTCENINECNTGSHNCGEHTFCIDRDPIKDGGKKYECLCMQGWMAAAGAGTKCNECKDNDECIEQPGICGNNSVCTNTPGAYSCSCEKGYKRSSDGPCVDENECERNPCPTSSTCNNTIGSFECNCIKGFIKEGDKCNANPDYFCANCDNATTKCTEAADKASFVCECLPNYHRVDPSTCAPNTYCDKAEVRSTKCAAEDRTNCTDLPDGSDFKCVCKEGYEGDGKTCEIINVCHRLRPCASVGNTRCEADKDDERNKYKCVCIAGHIRQKADIDDQTKPCYDTERPGVNNCTMCDEKTEICAAVDGDAHLKTCNCKDGYARGLTGKCGDINECAKATTNQCDPKCAVCVNKVPHRDNATYVCEVRKGFSGNGSLATCTDINECEKGEPCKGKHRVCVNTVGSYKCPCEPGFQSIPGVDDCVDINECTSGNFTCNEFSKCNNKEGSYECSCEDNFKQNGMDNGKVMCIDIDECNDGVNATGVPACHDDSETCDNTKGGHSCNCKPGFEKNADGVCVDRDECKDGVDNCDDSTTICNNTAGSFVCECKSKGLEKGKENNNTCININECTRGTHECSNVTNCVDTFGSYNCECKEGFEPLEDSFALRQICKRTSVCKLMKDTRNCGVCVDTDKPPFFNCSCLYGSINYNATFCITPTVCNDSDFPCPEGSTCTGGNCVCPRGMEWIRVADPLTIDKIHERKGCKEVNWCEKNARTCEAPAACQSTGPGTGECYCPDGFVLNKENKCEDVNECLNTTSPCPKGSDCKNLRGSFLCNCPEGFVQTSKAEDRLINPVCENINECTVQKDNCTSYKNTKCLDKTPGFSCDCIDGYHRSQTEQKCDNATCAPAECIDINECENKPCHADALCKNLPGTYDCECKEGFFGNGVLCKNIIECETGAHNCTKTIQKCVDTIGSFNCTCADGFEISEDGTCKNIVECDSPKLNDCPAKGMQCVDTPGDYYCVCPKGYSKDPVTGKCKDDNECVILGNTACSAEAGRCNNTVGDYECICSDGWRKEKACATASPKTCPCIDIKECTEGIIVGGSLTQACGKNAKCDEKPGRYECHCLPGYEGDPFKAAGCTEIDQCKSHNCEASEECRVTKEVPLCVCKDTFVRVGKACIPNPCLKDNGGCGEATCRIDTKNGSAICVCPQGQMLSAEEKCIDIDVCECGKESYPCRSELCPDKAGQWCYKNGESHKCICEKGFEFNETAKKCVDINECPTTPCPVGANCTNTVGSFACLCPRGQVYKDGKCSIDSVCIREEKCLSDPHAVCKNVSTTAQHCVCMDGYKGTALPGSTPCTETDPCEREEQMVGAKPCLGLNEVPTVDNGKCICACRQGYSKSGDKAECKDIDECKLGSFTCNKTLVCNNTVGSYECVCPQYYKMNNATGECVQDNKCYAAVNPDTCDPISENCDWRTGNCTCKTGFKAEGKNCTNIDECVQLAYDCPPNSKCVDTVGSYECDCIKGYTKNGTKCIDINECEKDPCPKNVSTCANLDGSYLCNCTNPNMQFGAHDCLKNETETGCKEKCHDRASCLVSSVTSTVHNCTCGPGFVGDGVKNCTNINECELGLDNCDRVNGECVDETPHYSCQCKPPFTGDGRTCTLPPLCTSKYNDCPKESDCIALKNATAEGKWVECKCKEKGLRFNPVTRKCEDINECTDGSSASNFTGPCPKEANCTNTEGSFNCICPTGYKHNPATGACENINECLLGLFHEKCDESQGKCTDTPGSWNCTCIVGYVNAKNDSQICEKDIFCGVKDACDKNTTTCMELNAGYRCECLAGLAPYPGDHNKCEDKNECKIGSHNCSLDGSEQCTNTWRGFACNCTNGYSKPAGKDKCLPDNVCTDDQLKSVNCGAYALCVTLPSTGGPKPTCICETGYIFNKEVAGCVPVPACANDFDCPSNSRCQLVQAQNKTGEVGTYSCVCAPGYEKIGHQCFPVKQCDKDPSVCGKGVCEDRLMSPFYECVCRPGSRQDNRTAECKELTCEEHVCSPNAHCLKREGGGIYCTCNEGFEGLGTISSPCKQVNPCTVYTPCSRFATCDPIDAVKYNCSCHEGYTGNGTWCINVNECENATLNNCGSNAICTDVQGSYTCTCKEGLTGKGTKGECKDIDECKLPKYNRCDAASTVCNNTVGGYACPCKEGYERADSAYACIDKNECANATICDIHKCSNLPGSHECNCLQGYENPPGDKKSCRDKNECTAEPCHSMATCANTPGSFNCTCKAGYKGDGLLNCTVIDICTDPALNKCDPTSTKCKMLPDRPEATCECKDGFDKISGVHIQCIDIDECADEATVPGEVACENVPGGFIASCKPGYEKVWQSPDRTNVTCRDIDECALDPAFAQSKKKLYAGAKGDWATWMVPPKDNSSAYALCYYKALAGTQFRLVKRADRDGRLPWCRNTAMSDKSKYEIYEPKLKGFECDCVPPTKRTDEYLVGRMHANCPSYGCPPCLTEYNYECVDQKCVCKKGFSERRIGDMSQCIQRECGPGEALPDGLKVDGKASRVRCNAEFRWEALPGWRIERCNKTGEVHDVVDINECVEMTEGACCSANAKCEGPLCATCTNIPGSYTCGNNITVCGAIDKQTCKCQDLACPKNTAWWYSCAGPAVPATVDTTKRVCSRIVDADGKPMTFDSMKALLDFAASRSCDCCFDPDEKATAKDMTINPAFNYYGPCIDFKPELVDTVKCEGGAKAETRENYSFWCPLRTSAAYPPKTSAGKSYGLATEPTPTCSNTLFIDWNGGITQF